MGNLLSSNRVKFENVRYLPAASISALVSTAVGLPFANPVRLLHITNLTDVDLLFSFDGVNSVGVISARGFVLYDYGSNKADSVGFLEQAVGERVYVQAITTLPSVRGVYVTVMYASQV